jgi:branched-chain amino acid transport system substrate-binding protein
MLQSGPAFPTSRFWARVARRVLVGGALACTVPLAAAQPPANRVLVGMSAPLTGPNAAAGTALAQGVRAALARANQAGATPQIELLLLDDGSQPDKALANTRALLAAPVVALTGYHGTGVVEAVMPLLDAQPVPLIGAASSAESLRTPPRPWLFNLRAAAGEETAAIVYHLDTIGIERIATIAQDDGFGHAGLEGVRMQLVRLSARPVAVAQVPVQAAASQLQEAVRKVCAATPQAVVLALNAGNALAAIRQARQQGCRPQFYLLSEAGGDLSSVRETAAELAGVVVSQVLPAPGRPTHPLVADYLQDLKRIDGAAPGYAGLEGYLYGRAVAAAVRLCGRTPGAECVLQVLERGRVDVPGVPLHFAPDQRRGSVFVELTMFGKDGGLRR